MHNGEWSLISFTLLSQLSVGLVMAFGFLFLMHQSVIENLSVGFSFKSPEFIILILILIATLLSFLHLGSPLHAYHSLNNLRGSWISREILMLSFLGLTVLLLMMSRMLNWSAVLTQLFLIMSMLNGLLLILAMSGIYLIPTVPSWNHFNTPFSFFGSAFILGSASMILFLMFSNSELLSTQLVKQFLHFILILTSILFISSIIHYYQLFKLEFTGIEQVVFKKGWFLILFMIRLGVMILITIGLIYLSFFALNSGIGFKSIKLIFTFIFFLILLEEVFGRYQFYSSYFRLGV